jgi:Zn-dependent peptidase ImmA (M78 family)/transcriptional regulator with XRE-family HTH domain
MESSENITSMEIGTRLKALRESLQISLEEVCIALKISELDLRSIESGSIEQNYRATYGMICLYGKPLHEIFGNFFANETHPSYFLRDKTDVPSELKQYVLDCIIAFHRRLHGKPPHLYPVEKSVSRKVSARKLVSAVLESRASDLINQHGLHRLPINIYQIANNLNIFVTFETLPSDLYDLRGFSYREGDFQLIGINKAHSIELQRFTMAHELHHLLFDPDIRTSPFLCGAYNEYNPIEQNAERFAAELLMPRPLVSKLISNPSNIKYLTIHLVAQHFRVSYQAAAIRLQNFNLIDSSLEACKPYYRKRDKEKTNFLLANKLEYIRALFGLETGIAELQLDSSHKSHEACGMPIFDLAHDVCWYCGLQIKESKSSDFLIKNPYRQSKSNLIPDKVVSFDRKKDVAQLSLNLTPS